jgi:hypothetical protein
MRTTAGFATGSIAHDRRIDSRLERTLTHGHVLERAGTAGRLASPAMDVTGGSR